MKQARYSAYNYFYDSKKRKIVKRAGELVREQRKEPLRYTYIGSYFAHQPQPYIEDGFVCRKLYGKRVILMSTTNQKQTKEKK